VFPEDISGWMGIHERQPRDNKIFLKPSGRTESTMYPSREAIPLQDQYEKREDLGDCLLKVGNTANL
jgi:hypothetical protein